IERGDSNIVECAELGTSERKAVLKNQKTDAESQLDEIFLKDFKREIKLLKVLHHPSLNKFYDPTRQTYMLVSQYANERNLCEYLTIHRDSLKWEDKRQISLDIARGICYLHSKNIIHGNLHFNNILVHNSRMMIADFDLSKFLDKSMMSNNSFVKGISGYFDPRCVPTLGSKRNKKSDILSYGVVLWEISHFQHPISPLNLIEGNHKKLIELHEICQNITPDERPNIEDIISILADSYILKDYSDNNKKSLSQCYYSTYSYPRDLILTTQESYTALDTRQEDIQFRKSISAATALQNLRIVFDGITVLGQINRIEGF
ncbi:18364_t:CDS:2, partial [Acaulospora morrowiae]